MTGIPRRWRNFAQETRALAEKIVDPDNKRIVLEIADKYDRLAEVAKKRMNAPMIKKRKGEP